MREQTRFPWYGDDPIPVVESDIEITPPEFQAWLDDERWHVHLDPCAARVQTIRADANVRLPDDGDGLAYLDRLHRHRKRSVAGAADLHVWCNPPYSRPLPWVEACVLVAGTRDAGCVMLLRGDLTTRASWLACGYATWAIVLRDRVRFGQVVIRNGQREVSFDRPRAPFGSLLVAFGPAVPDPPKRIAHMHVTRRDRLERIMPIVTRRHDDASLDCRCPVCTGQTESEGA